MPFFTFSNTDIKFAQKKLTWRSYTAAEALPTIKQVELIDRKEFAKTVLDKHVKAFVIHMISFSIMAIHPAKKT